VIPTDAEAGVNLREELNAVTPRLRRYARALATGNPAPCDAADELVRATLMRALGARTIGSAGDLLVRLYATVTQLHRETAMVGRSAAAATGAGSQRGRPALVSGSAGMPAPARYAKLSAGLLSLSLEEREALLLVALEGFDHGDAARILRISRQALVTRLTRARTALDAFLQTRPAAKPALHSVPYLRLVT
jgi:RNA polymerase sigma-70 factor, ECF subfamily